MGGTNEVEFQNCAEEKFDSLILEETNTASKASGSAPIDNVEEEIEINDVKAYIPHLHNISQQTA